MITENLQTLKIHKLSKAQYERELANGTIDENAIYLTPDEEVDLSGYVTVDQLDGKADAEHTHDDRYYTETEIDTKFSDITSGTIVVKEAEHATSADSAEEATHATSADTAISATTAGSADKATKDGSGNIITDTYETKTDATAKYEAAIKHTDDAVKNLISSTAVDTKISDHNVATNAHNDIRGLITELSTKVNNFLDVDDKKTDQLSEILELINNNKGTLDSITSNKVNVSDIVDNLTTAVATKVLSANQGVEIKKLIDALSGVVEGKSDEGHKHVIADVNGLQDALDGKAASSHGTHVTWSTTSPKMNGTATVGSETKVARGDHVHPVDTSRASKTEFDNHVASTVSHITAAERTKWNAKASTASATTAAAGLMSSADKTKLNGIAEGANNYSHPTTSGNKHIPSGGSEGLFLKWSADGTAVWAADNNTTYSNATSTTAGLVKSGSTVTSTNGLTAVPIINGIPYYKNTTYSNATSTTAGVVKVDTTLSSSSTNPVQNKVVDAAMKSATSAITANANSIATLTEALGNIQEISSEEITALFA